jgi:hypothetical protein
MEVTNQVENLSSLFALNQSSNRENIFNQKPKNNFLNQSDSTDALPKGFSIKGGDLGIFSKNQLADIASGKLQPKELSFLSKGTDSSGIYNRRGVFVENGSQNFGSGSPVGGQFIRNTEYQVNGFPFQTGGSADSVKGQFPINGQFLNNGLYNSQIEPPSQGDSIVNGQYAINGSDPAAKQFSYKSDIKIKGDISGDGPFRIVKASFVNGQYELEVQSATKSVLNVGNSTVNIGGNSIDSGQLLVNGSNSYKGIYRALDQFTVRGQITLDGSYNEDGKYEVNGVALENGSNRVSAKVSDRGVVRQEEVVVNGRYNDSGQFILNNPLSATPAKPAEMLKDPNKILSLFNQLPSQTPAQGRVFNLAA